MKKLNFIKGVILQGTVVASILLVASCNNTHSAEDSKTVAKDQNRAVLASNDNMNNNNNNSYSDKQQEKDAQFLVNAAEINLAQIQLGKQAQKSGNSLHVKELGKMMDDSHTKSQRELTALAKRKGVDVPNSPTKDSNNAYTKLNEKSGNDFDKAYADEMVSGHKDAISTFEKASKNANDTEIRNWATSSLPEMRENLDHSVASQKKCNKM